MIKQKKRKNRSAGFRITKEETKKRMGYTLLGVFSFYLVEPFREVIETYVDVNPIAVGVVGIVAVLYFFDF